MEAKETPLGLRLTEIVKRQHEVIDRLVSINGDLIKALLEISGSCEAAVEHGETGMEQAIQSLQEP